MTYTFMSKTPIFRYINIFKDLQNITPYMLLSLIVEWTKVREQPTTNRQTFDTCPLPNTIPHCRATM